MSEGSQSPEIPSLSPYKQEIKQFKNRHSAISITEQGAKFDFVKKKPDGSISTEGTHKYNPAASRTNEGIVRTSSDKGDNDYYIGHDKDGGTFVVNIGETRRTGKLVAIQTPGFPAPIPSVEIGKPWGSPESNKPSTAKELLLKYGVGAPVSGAPLTQIDASDPFEEYRELVYKHKPELFD